ncbi:type I-E CRISPR-associated protein Cse1/CasA [Kitasatospora sp. NBC_01300]|uniref:type I-E CRISPR-associated protein Cse1/CasA n=1 Tax=Kitasatospora sp. NBC_01300 TaxID=2903574 RepID=UPI00352BEA19|nr:type I-E CRISPR-associated protein Cse1/CasA [Kitasatospora sp. NBC_01300]
MRWDPRHQACIPVLTIDGVPVRPGPADEGEPLRSSPENGDEPSRAGLAKVSVVQALRYADRIAAVYGRTPGETVAVLDWLLGVLYAAECCPETYGEWLAWVERREPLTEAADWLVRHEGVWDLFDAERPLGQNAALLKHLDAFGVGPAQLVIEQAGDYNQHFDHRHLHHPEPLPADAAWRAMLTQHAFGQGRRARIPAKEMGLPAPFTNLSTCRLGSRIRVLALGPTLGDTLRLNLAPWDGKPDALNLTWGDRSRRPFRRTGAHETRRPEGPADLHTVLGRSVALRAVAMADGEPGVDRVLVGPGETLAELPDVYRQDEVMVMRAGKPVTLKPQASRELWRESHALYAAVAERVKGNDLYGRLAMLRSDRPELWAVGLLADKGQPITWVDDRFPFVPGREAGLRQASEQGSAVAEYAAGALRAAATTACEHVYSGAGDRSAHVARFNGEPELWAGAGVEFHAMLDAVADGHPVADALSHFGTGIRTLATAALKARLDSLRPSGRELKAHTLATERLQVELDRPDAPNPLKETTP